MQKILILSNYFPPCNLTSSERIFSWALHFKQLGLYPIIITRNWEVDSTIINNYYLPSGIKLEHQVFEDYEIYNLPYKPNFNDNYILKHCNKFHFKFIYPFSRFLNLILENFTLQYNSFYSFYLLANKLIQEQQINNVLISAFPFYLFKIGSMLKKNNPQIKWIADYRDDWNSNTLDGNADSFFKKLAKNIETKSELKWVKTAEFFTTVSEVYADRISKFTNKIGHVIENGYLEENYKNLKSENKIESEFSIVYAGNVFHNQNFKIVIDSVQHLINKGSRIKVIFLGLDNLHPEYVRIKSYVNQKYIDCFEFLPRKTKAEALQLQKESTILFTSAYGDLKGLPSSKLYDYIALRKPVLLCPSDNDYMHSALQSTGQLIFANSVEECIKKLENLYLDFNINGKVTEMKLHENEILKFSRYYSSQKLVQLIKKQIN